MALPSIYHDAIQDDISMWDSQKTQYYKSLKNVTKMIENAQS